MRFDVDEHVAKAVVAGLRRRGVDVTSASEVGLLGASDEQHLGFGLKEGRVVFTQDEDYFTLASGGMRRADIVYCHQHSSSFGEMIAALLLIHECMQPEEMQDHVEFI